MTIPDHINGRWIATLDNDQLVRAEAALHAAFRAEEKAAKARAGARYMLLQGPPALVSAWQRWMLLNNAAQTRGLAAHRRV
jgi:hypothetical protein